MILINSWWFDFQNMVAYRDPSWKYHKKFAGSNVRNIIVRSDGRIAKAWAEPMQPEFFDSPEERFNEDINKAYETFLFERDILGTKV